MGSPLVPDWKQEPLSPIFDELTPVSEDVLLYWIDLEQPDLKLETENVTISKTKDINSEMADDLDNIEDLNEWIKQGKKYSLAQLTLKTFYKNILVSVKYNKFDKI